MSQAGMQVYRGAVSHLRSSPERHGFTYEIFMFLLDLDAADSALARYWPFTSVGGWTPVAFRPGSHMRMIPKTGAAPLVETVRTLVEAKIGSRPQGKILLLTNLSYFGYGFNPVSFYYVYNAPGTRVDTVIAEVTNTPWNEQHYYVLDYRSAGVTQFAWQPDSGWQAVTAASELDSITGACFVDHAAAMPIVGESVEQAAVHASTGAVAPCNYAAIATAFQETRKSNNNSPSPGTPPLSIIPRRLRFRFQKDFHVSPFMPMDQQYEWIFSEPADTVLVQNMNIDNGKQVFVSQLRLTRQALSWMQLLYLLFVAFPLLTHRIQLWIHLEALQLWWKGVALFPHPHGSTNGFTKLVSSVMAPFIALATMFSGLRVNNKNE